MEPQLLGEAFVDGGTSGWFAEAGWQHSVLIVSACGFAIAEWSYRVDLVFPEVFVDAYMGRAGRAGEDLLKLDESLHAEAQLLLDMLIDFWGKAVQAAFLK